MRFVAVIFLAALGGCASVGPNAGLKRTDYRDPAVRVQAVADRYMQQWQANSGDDSAMPLDLLQATEKAIKAGGVAAEMAMFWLDTINRRRDSEMRKAKPLLIRELQQSRPGERDGAFKLAFPEIAAQIARDLANPDFTTFEQVVRYNSEKAESDHAVHPAGFQYSGYWSTKTYHDADNNAVCSSLIIAPRHWNQAHPNGPLFDFSTKGIDVFWGTINRCPGLRERWPGSDYAPGGRSYDAANIPPEPKYND